MLTLSRIIITAVISLVSVCHAEIPVFLSEEDAAYQYLTAGTRLIPYTGIVYRDADRDSRGRVTIYFNETRSGRRSSDIDTRGGYCEFTFSPQTDRLTSVRTYDIANPNPFVIAGPSLHEMDEFERRMVLRNGVRQIRKLKAVRDGRVHSSEVLDIFPSNSDVGDARTIQLRFLDRNLTELMCTDPQFLSLDALRALVGRFFDIELALTPNEPSEYMGDEFGYE